MSLKDEIEYVKTELSGDEKVLESAFKLESFYKRHKKTIWAITAIVVLAIVAKTGADMLEASRLEAANNALSLLQRKPDDANALKTLKEKNPKLYALYTLSQAAKKKNIEALEALSSDSDTIVSDMARYSAAELRKKPVDSQVYKELAYVQEAYALIKEGKMKAAKRKLELISERSSVASVARLLEHYTIKAE